MKLTPAQLALATIALFALITARSALAADAKVTITRTPAGPDSSVLTGSGLNTKPWGIDKVVPGGVMRKDPGSRTWYFVKGMTPDEIRQQHERRMAEVLAKRGHERHDIVIDVPGTNVAKKLRVMKIEVKDAPPCTLLTTILYRQIPELQKQGIVYWEKGKLRPGSAQDPRKKDPTKTPKQTPGPPPPQSSGKPVPPPDQP